MKRSKNSIAVWILLLCVGCGDDGAKELREFAKIEAAIGMVAGASTFDRGIRLEQLESMDVHSARVTELQRSCAAAYRSFDRAAGLLESARQRTEAVAVEVKSLQARKAATGTLSPEEESRVLEMSKSAASTLKSVTKELDTAEEKVAACQAKRGALRQALSNR